MSLGKKKPAARQRQRPIERTPMAYYRSGEASTSSTSPFERANRNKGKSRKFVIAAIDIVLLGAIILVFIYSLIVKPDAKVLLTNQTYRSAIIYQKAAVEQFKALKNRNKITLDEQAVIKSLQHQFPEIASASVELPLFGQTPIIHLNIAPPSLVLSSAGTNYLVDSNGTAVAKAVDFPKIKNLPALTDQTGFVAKAGKQVMSAANVNFVNSLLVQCKHSKLPIASLTLPPLAQELDLRSQDKPYYVKFYLGGDVNQQIGQFLAAHHQFESSGTQPAQYLDVRVPGKVFYK